jgi:hypothetical protein
MIQMIPGGNYESDFTTFRSEWSATTLPMVDTSKANAKNEQ